MADFSKDKLALALKNGIGAERVSAQIERAFQIAYRGHQDQYREQVRSSDPPVPYIVHPVGVAIIATELLPQTKLNDSFDDVISACLTHDLLEDSEITLQELARATSQRTADIVSALTKPSVPNDASRQQRNDRFLRQIISAGKTAAFVKVCDQLQNIARPDRTPSHLLEKAIQRSRSTYLALFEDDLLPMTLRSEFLKRLERAEAERNERVLSDPRRAFNSLSEAIDFCIGLSERKTLEVHDILEALQIVSGAASIVLLTNEQFVSSFISDTSTSALTRAKAQITAQLTKGRFDLVQLPREIAEIAGLGSGTIYSVDIGLDDARGVGRRAIMVVPELLDRSWLTLNTLRVIASHLSQRLKLVERSRLRNLATASTELRLDVDLDDVAALNLTHADLVALRSIVDQAEYVRSILEASIVHYLRPNDRNTHPVEIASRVKTPRSILAKLIRAHLSGYEALEDIVGIRIVCSSKKMAQSVADNLVSYLSSSKSIADLDVEVVGSMAATEITSKSGYRALHICLVVSSKNSPSVRLGCELQIRTIFQDAWARLSERLSYKKGSPTERRHKERLRNLAEIRDRADALLDEV